MRNKESYRQKDLFANEGHLYKKKNCGLSSVPRMRNLLVISVFVIIGTICSFGAGFFYGTHRYRIDANIEKNRIQQPDKPQRVSLAKYIRKEKDIRKEDARIAVLPPKREDKKLETLPPKERKKTVFTVQLVTYKSQNRALQKISKLKKKGLDPLLIKDGKFFIICAGKYDSWRSAKNRLPYYRKLHNDSFVRKLKRGR